MQQSASRQVQRHFDGIAEAYYRIVDDVWYEYGYFHRKELQFLLDSVEQGSRLAIDAGCGPGRHLITLSARAQRVVAVDISRNMLYQAKRMLGSQSASTTDLVQADVRHLPFKDSVADCIVNLEVLEHLPGGMEGVLAALQSLRRVLKKRGKLITEAPLFIHKLVNYAAPPSLKEITPEMRKRYYMEAPITVGNVFSGRLIEALLRAAGFSVSRRAFIRVLPSGIIERFPDLVNVDELMAKVPVIRNASRELVWLAEAT